MTRFVLAAALSVCTLVVAAPAWAQSGGVGQGGAGGIGQGNAVSLRPKPEDTVGPARRAPPPALPGAQTQGGAAPATKPAAEMSPNDALFDAINRGDIAGARDALSRGADLNAQNILGMTPMELSVDLGRNDIAFLLLSMRGGERPRRGSAPAQADAAADKPAGKSAARKPAAVKVTAVAANRADQTPRLFANDGGTPVPAAGFLGFDTGRGMR